MWKRMVTYNAKTFKSFAIYLMYDNEFRSPLVFYRTLPVSSPILAASTAS